MPFLESRPTASRNRGFRNGDDVRATVGESRDLLGSGGPWLGDMGFGLFRLAVDRMPGKDGLMVSFDNSPVGARRGASLFNERTLVAELVPARIRSNSASREDELRGTLPTT